MALVQTFNPSLLLNGNHTSFYKDFNGIYPSSQNKTHIFNDSSIDIVNYQHQTQTQSHLIQQQQNNKLLSSKINNINYEQTKHKSSETLPYQSSTLSLAAFAFDIEKEITDKILNKLQLKKDNPNNIIMVTLCKFMDEIIDNINKNMVNIGTKFEESFNTFRKQQQQQQQLNQHNNNKQFNLLTNKLNTTMCNATRLEELFNNNNQTKKNIKLENILDKHQLQHQKSFNIMSKKQQQLQLQINLDQELKKVIKIINIQNKKFDELQNKINNIQLDIKQSAKKQNNILTNMMNKKNKFVQQRSPVKQFGIFEEKQLTEDKIKLMTNKVLNKMQQQQKIYQLSLEKMSKKLDDQTNKLIYNNNIGINKILKQTKIIKNNFKQIVSDQINNLNDVKNLQKNMKSDEIINSNNNKLNIKEETLANKLIKNQKLFLEKINYMQTTQNQMAINIKKHANVNQHQYIQKQQLLQQQQQQLYQQQNINQNNNQFQNINQIHDNLQIYKSHRMDMANFMNEAVKTLKTANTAITTIAND